MKTKKSNLRYPLLLLILTCYLMPLIILISYNVLIENGSEDFEMLSFGLFLSAIGSLILFWSMTKWESSLPINNHENSSDNNSVLPREELSLQSMQHQDFLESIDKEEFELAKLSLAEAQQMQIRLLAEIDSLAADLQIAKTDKISIQKTYEAFISQTNEERTSTSKQLEDQQTSIRNLHQKIAEQKAMLDKKELHSSSLESKVGDLTYEIKTLLQLAEAHSGSLFNTDSIEASPTITPPSKHSETTSHKAPQSTSFSQMKMEDSNEGSNQLKKSISIAQKITGSQRFGSQLYSSVESPVESFAIDLRRLCDRLRMDIISSNCTVLLYSPRDCQLLFAGNQIRDLTGWSPEKFIQVFNEILQDENVWKNGISSLSMRSEAVIPLSVKTRNGQTASFQTYLGMIPTGIFRNHIIALLVHQPI